jgi:chromatin structure-remodeling complex protein RSC7
MHFPKITQPTHAKWEQLPVAANPPSDSQKYLTNGTSDHDAEPQPTIFQPVSKVIARNFLITDTVFTAPPLSSVAIPGPDGDMLAINHNGLPDISDDILAELPSDCKAALLAAKREEKVWKESWNTESQDGLRGNLKIGFLGFPV